MVHVTCLSQFPHIDVAMILVPISSRINKTDFPLGEFKQQITIQLTLQAELVYPCGVPHTFQGRSADALMRRRRLGLVSKGERVCFLGGPGRCGAQAKARGPEQAGTRWNLKQFSMTGQQHLHQVIIRATRIGNCVLCSNYSPLCFSP